MERMMDLITSGRGMEKIGSILLSVLPALIIGAVLFIIYIAALKVLKNKGNAQKIAKLEKCAPYFYLAFMIVLWLFNSEAGGERIFDVSLTLTPGKLFYFTANLLLIAPFSFLLVKTGTKPVIALIAGFAFAVLRELLQFALVFGSASVLSVIAMLIGTLLGVIVARAIQSKREKTEQ